MATGRPPALFESARALSAPLSLVLLQGAVLMPFPKSEKARRTAKRLRQAAYRVRMAPAEDARVRAAAAVAIAPRLAAALPSAPPAPLSPAARAAPSRCLSVRLELGSRFFNAAAAVS